MSIRRSFLPFFLAAPVFATAALAIAGTPTKETVMNIHELTVNTIDGKPQALSTYKGKVVLVVNVASQCGFTPQYAGLEKLYEEYKGKGLVILGFPSNDFGGQEPGTAEEIKKFCSLKYNVTFPLFEKVKTHGDGQAPIYKYLGQKGEPKWNFHKYLVGKDGVVKSAYASKVTPDSTELRSAIDAALKE